MNPPPTILCSILQCENPVAGYMLLGDVVDMGPLGIQWIRIPLCYDHHLDVHGGEFYVEKDEKDEKVTMYITRRTDSRLKKNRQHGESYDEEINRLLDSYEGH
jgi:hypothetical protein